MNGIRRAAFLAATGAAAIAARPAVALTPVRVGSSPNDDLIAVLWLVDSGAFRAAGLDVDLQKANSGAAVAAAVVGDALDIGKSSILSIVAARAKGLPFLLIAPCGMYNGDAPTIGMIVAHDSPIKTAQDCNGKIVGVSALNDLFTLGTQAWVDRNGGNSKTLRFLEMPSAAMADAVVAGRIDAATLADPQLGQAVEGGRTRILCAPDTAIAKHYMQAAYFATAAYVAQNSATIATFRRVIDESGAYANGHREQMIPVISKFTGVAESVLRGLPPQPVATALDVRLVQPVIDVAMRYNAIPAGFDARTMVDPGLQRQIVRPTN